MDFSNNNSFDQLPIKIVKKRERLQTVSGQTVELRYIQTQLFENNKILYDECIEVDPPLADSRVPESIGDIRECSVCLQLYHKDNCYICPCCGGYYCRLPQCRGIVKDEIEVCSICAAEINKSTIAKLWDKFWNLED